MSFTLNDFFAKIGEAAYFVNNKFSKENHSTEKVEKLVGNLQSARLDERGLEDPIDLPSLAFTTIFESEQAINAFKELSENVELIKDSIYDKD